MIFFFSLAFISLSFQGFSQSGSRGKKLTISRDHPQYFEFGGEPLLLLGGSDNDNLFQSGNVKEQLDHLKAAGGNYVRCTMSSRDEGDEWSFHLNKETDKYDLTQWNEVYWNRFHNFLKLTAEREIIVQIEVWATFDFYRSNWLKNPFNPENNQNYTVERTKLPTEVPSHPTRTNNAFFRTIPSSPETNFVVLGYQQKFVDKLLSYTLQYGHILYCIDNETSVSSEWGKFWAGYIKTRAKEETTQPVLVTEMWDPWDLDHIAHRQSFDHPEIYDFVEISQNNHKKGQEHWDNGRRQIERLKKRGFLRPVTNVKIYGANQGKHGGDDNDAIEKFVRNVLFGAASARFHRPTSGIGVSEKARAVIRSLRMATDSIDFFRARPFHEPLSNRDDNEAYAIGNSGGEMIVYFPGKGQVNLEIPQKKFQIHWLDVNKAAWQKPKVVRGKDLSLKNPFERHGIAIIKPV